MTQNSMHQTWRWHWQARQAKPQRAWASWAGAAGYGSMVSVVLWSCGPSLWLPLPLLVLWLLLRFVAFVAFVAFSELIRGCLETTRGPRSPDHHRPQSCVFSAPNRLLCGVPEVPVYTHSRLLQPHQLPVGVGHRHLLSYQEESLDTRRTL